MSWQVLGQIAFQEHFPIDGVAQDEETRLFIIVWICSRTWQNYVTHECFSSDFPSSRVTMHDYAIVIAYSLQYDVLYNSMLLFFFCICSMTFYVHKMWSSWESLRTLQAQGAIQVDKANATLGWQLKVKSQSMVLMFYHILSLSLSLYFQVLFVFPG